MFYFIMRILKKLTVAIGSRTMEYRIDDENGEIDFNIWRKRLTYAWHLQNDKMSCDMMDFTEYIYGYDIYDITMVTMAQHRAWTKEDEAEFIKQGCNPKHLRRIAMIMYIYRLVRFPFNYFMSFFINLDNVKSSEMFDSNN